MTVQTAGRMRQEVSGSKGKWSQFPLNNSPLSQRDSLERTQWKGKEKVRKRGRKEEGKEERNKGEKERKNEKKKGAKERRKIEGQRKNK